MSKKSRFFRSALLCAGIFGVSASVFAAGSPVTKIRFYPRSDIKNSPTEYPDRMINGVFEATTGSKDNGPYTLLYKITSGPTPSTWKEIIPSDTTTKYNYVRYRGEGFCNVAEVQFYTGATKANGPIFGTPGSWAGSGMDYTKVFDGDISTFMDYPTEVGGYAGMQIGDAYVDTSKASTNQGWEFSWSDEFNGTEVDPEVWGYEVGKVRNNEAQYYSKRTENSRIDNGTLLIQALRDNWNGNEYTSASRTTAGKKEWKYGRFEMRAKIDVQMGSWPAWWWLPIEKSWPDGGEIDMMEFYKGKCLFNVMDVQKNWTSMTVSVKPDWEKNYHVWTMDWDSTKIDLYLDGELINHYNVSDAVGKNADGSHTFRTPGYMILNQAMGGSQGGDITNMTFPVDFRVDWVRVHTMSSGTSHTLTVNNGAGSGVYRDGTKASITAKLPLSKDTFVVWTVQPAGVVIEGIDKATAVITMPSSNVTVTPTFYATKPVVSVRSVSVSRALSVRNSPVEVFDIRGRRVGSTSSIATSHGLAGMVYFYRNGDGTFCKSVRINSRDVH